MLLEMHRLMKPKEKKIITLAEFNITQLFMNILGIEVDSDYSIYDGSNDDIIPEPFIRGTKLLGYCERYSSLAKIPPKMALFRPIFNDYDASLLMDIATNQNLIDFDIIEIKEFMNSNNMPKYKGCLIKDNEVVPRSLIKTSPTIPILKCSILAALLMDENEHAKYMNNLYSYLYGENWMLYKKEQTNNDTNTVSNTTQKGD